MTTKVTESSGNVFEDLGIDQPEDALAKSGLALSISRIVDENGWSDHAAASEAGLESSDILNLRVGRLANYTLDRLIKILNKLGQDVEIKVSAKPSNRDAHLVVMADSGLEGDRQASA